jgi:hypothetical protein
VDERRCRLTPWILVFLQALEVGFWFGQAGYRRRHRERIRERLVWGRQPATRLPFIDERLRKAAGVPTRLQTRVANGIVRAARWAAHTRAFELVILRAACERWPTGGRLDSKVNLV